MNLTDYPPTRVGRARTRHAAKAIGLLLTLGLAGMAHAGPLGDVLQATLKHPAIQARQMQSQAAGSDLSASTARYFGRGSLLADQTRFDDQHVVGYFFPGQTTPALLDNNITRFGLNYSLPVDLFGVIAAARDKAKNNLAAAEWLTQQETLLRLHQATTAYTRKQALKAQADALRVQRERVQASVARVRQEVELGRSAGVDLSLAESDLARLRADEARLQGILGDTRADLLDASGMDPEVGSDSLAAPAWQPIEAKQTLSVRIAQARADALQAASSEARRSLLPSLNVGADYFNNRGGSGNNNTWSLGLRLSLPLDASALHRNAADGARALAAQDEVRTTQQTAQRQISALQSAYTSATQDALALQAEATFRTEVVGIEEEKWRLGSQTLENLLRQRRDLLDAQYRLADARARTVAAWSSAQVLAGTQPASYIEQLDK